MKSLSNDLKFRFGGKIAKLTIDGGFSCPNRKNGQKGCVFCNDQGGGDFCMSHKSIQNQIRVQKEKTLKKWSPIGYIAYFQAYTNTYASTNELKEKYDQALQEKDVVGLAIATRPDCLSQEIISLLNEYNQKIFLWVELGFQSSKKTSIEWMNRGYDNPVFDQSVHDLTNVHIPVVAHVIAGLPNETKEDFIDTVKYISSLPIWGVKFHCFYIQKNSNLYQEHLKNPYPSLSQQEYVDWIVTAFDHLPQNCVIHRLTGDGDQEKLVAPLWTKNKLQVLSEISKGLAQKNIIL